MKIRYYIDPETELPNIYGHDVEEIEVEEILSNPGEDRPGKKGRELLLDVLRTGVISE